MQRLWDVKRVFFFTFFAVFLSCSLVLAIFIINWTRPISIVMYCLLCCFTFSFSFLFSKRLLSLFLEPYELQKLDVLKAKPKVAILYTTVDDVVPECLISITQRYKCDIYVLDDSSRKQVIQVIDSVVRYNGFMVVKRKHRKDFKAGALNNWLSKYGANYDYLVLLDADSFIPEDWVEEALKYAEHPANEKVAIFQGLINIWNLDNCFTNTLAPLYRLGQDVWEKKLANHLDAVFCYGHNVMIRIRPLLEIGGFRTGCVSEDFGTAVKLADRGYKSRFVPLHTYEAIPENIRGFVKRQRRWTRGAMEFFGFMRDSRISLSQKMILGMIPLSHISYVFILLAMFLTIFGYPSTFADFGNFAHNLLLSPILYILSIPIFRYIIVLGIVSGIPLQIKLRQQGIGQTTYLKNQLLSRAIGAVMLPHEVSSMIRYLMTRRRGGGFPVTPKNEPSLSVREIFMISRIVLVLIVLFTIGLVWINPLGVFYNISWLWMFYVSPVVIYFFSKAPDNPPKQTLHNGDGFSASCLKMQYKAVHTLLSIRRTFVTVP